VVFSYLFISHDLALVRMVADEVAVLYQGRLCEVGPTRHVYAAPFHPYTATLLAAVPEPVPGRSPRALKHESSLGVVPAHGCPFFQRCPRRIETTCAQIDPPWRLAEGGHAIRCHLTLEQLSEPIEVLPLYASAPSRTAYDKPHS